MFWGLIMEPQRRYTQQVKKGFHISMAALDMSSSSDEPSQVMCGYEGRNYLLCTLQKPNILQCPLDLSFSVDTEVSFAANGKCHIHLTGYLADFSDEEVDDVEEEEEGEEEEEVAKTTKRVRKEENNSTNKKAKIEVSSSQVDNSDESEDDDDFEVDVEEEEEGDDAEEEEDNDDDDEEDDESDEESSLSDQEENSENEIEEVKVNGVSKKKVDKEATNQQKQKAKQTVEKNQTPGKKRNLQGGVIVEELVEGQGKVAKTGKFISVYYEGRLKSNNKVFDSTKKGAGFSFRLGNGEVIKGWDIGVAGMKVGGKRRITCPPQMAYGPRGSPPTIPPNSTLVFEVELKKAQ